MSDILYLKAERNVEVNHRDVTLGDVAKLECANTSVVSRLKTLKLLKIRAEKSDRCIVSILKVVEQIHTVYPNLEIQNLGEADFIVAYEPEVRSGERVFQSLKVILVCLIVFFGSAFSIMAFNNDVGVNQVFHQIYEQVMGTPSDGFTILELTYSVGIAAGILIFYNHVGGKRLTKDPTPMEVEMRLYEEDVNTTLIESSSRKGTNLDVE